MIDNIENREIKSRVKTQKTIMVQKEEDSEANRENASKWDFDNEENYFYDISNLKEEEIIKKIDGVKILDPNKDDYPFSYVGLIISDFKEEGKIMGTGVMISHNCVLTVANNVFKLYIGESKMRLCDNISFSLNKNGSFTYPDIKVKYVYTHDGFPLIMDFEESNKYDLAILILAEPIGKQIEESTKRKIDFIDYNYLQMKSITKYSMCTIGYIYEKTQKYFNKEISKPYETVPFTICDLSTEGFFSYKSDDSLIIQPGSPIFIKSGKEYKLIGLQQRTCFYRDLNFGIKIGQFIKNNIKISNDFETFHYPLVKLVKPSESFSYSFVENVSKSISRDKNLTSLHLDLKGIYFIKQEEEVLQIGEVIKDLKVSSLYLDFSYNLINIDENGVEDRRFPLIFLGLLKELKNLTTLYLDISYNTIMEKGVKSLGLNSTLKEMTRLTILNLDLAGNKIGDKGLKLLGIDLALKELKQLICLNLNLSKNSIGDEGIESLQLGNSLKELNKLSVLTIDLNSNLISDKGIELMALHIGIKELNKLTFLSLNLSQNLIGYKRNEFIEDARRRRDILCNKKSKDLNEENKKKYDEKISKIEKIIKDTSNILHFDEAFKDLLKLKSIYINLSKNYLGSCCEKEFSFVTILKDLLKIHSLKLDLSGNNIIDSGLRELNLCSTLKDLSKLKYLILNFSDNKLSNDATANFQIANSLKKLCKLRTIIVNFSKNYIQDDGVNNIFSVSSLKDLDKLNEINIDFTWNPVSDEHLLKFENSLRALNIKSLILNNYKL